MKTITSLAMITFMLCGLSNAYGQNGTVQQPVFRNFSVGTTVSVPDRGSAHLGSVSRAASGTKNIGFYNLGSSIGKINEHAGASSHVYIHDFEEMDQYLLNQGNSNRDSQYMFSTRGASSAYSSLSRKSPSSRRTYIRSNKPERAPSRASKVSRYIMLGERAEKRGKLSLARLHYRMAEKNGSNLASTRLAQLAKKKESQVTKRN